MFLKLEGDSTPRPGLRPPVADSGWACWLCTGDPAAGKKGQSPHHCTITKREEEDARAVGREGKGDPSPTLGVCESGAACPFLGLLSFLEQRRA